MRHPMNTGPGTTPKPSEGESNMSPRRARWAERTHGPEVRAALEADAGQFLHQSVSTPCLSVAARAYGPYVEDTEGRRYLDFHGNNVHHVGYGHPRLKAAIARQMDELPFAPRRFACEPATALAAKLADLAPGISVKGAVHHRRLRRRRGGAQDRPRRHRTVQDRVVLGCLPRRRLRRCFRRRRAAVPLPCRGAAAVRHRARGALRLLPLPLRLSRGGRAPAARTLPADLRAVGALRAGEGRRRGRGHRRTGPGRALHAAAGLLGGGARRPATTTARC